MEKFSVQEEENLFFQNKDIVQVSLSCMIWIFSQNTHTIYPIVVRIWAYLQNSLMSDDLS